jgi:hypothetical protein
MLTLIVAVSVVPALLFLEHAHHQARTDAYVAGLEAV